MDEYLQSYDTYDRTIVYYFELSSGGIGDLTKFFMHLLNVCIEHKIKLRYFVMGLRIEKYLKMRHEKMYIHRHELNNPDTVNSIEEIKNILPHKIYLCYPQIFYPVGFNYELLTIPLSTVFAFSDDILSEDAPYASIHLRLGDQFLETDPNYVVCRTDTRAFDEAKLHRCIESCSETLMFFCDNRSYKENIKKLYPKLHITDYDIGHTSLTNTTKNQIRNSVREFYLLSKSTHIYRASLSGFSIMAAKMNMIPIETI
jgi:hypothetical protein